MYAYLVTYHNRDEVYLAENISDALKEASAYVGPSSIEEVKRLAIVENLESIVHKFNHSKAED